ncbi:MAG TPA: VOC family protein [Baekduia sp.]|jgi:catechol 2,3-dioxygenase-like lactoylglutathione lyase family enzyme|nr:VOC family protein [Baekduia sp.]
MIASIGHVAIQVPDLDAAVAYATELLGLQEVERVDGTSYLTHSTPVATHGVPHHSMQYIEGPVLAMDHIGLQAADHESLDAVRASLEAAGVSLIADAPQDAGVAESIRFRGPAGHTFEVYRGMDEVPAHTPSGIRANRFGHVTIKSGDDIWATLDFLVDVLGFTISDWIGPKSKALLGFARTNPYHHSIAVLTGPSGLYHYAYEVASAGELLDFSDALDGAGRQLIWGPGRHGAGENVAVYHLDQPGVQVEHYADMELILDDRPPREWSLDDPRGINAWGPQFDASVFELGIPNVE